MKDSNGGDVSGTPSVPPVREDPSPGMTWCVCGAADYCGSPKACKEEWLDRLDEDYAEEQKSGL